MKKRFLVIPLILIASLTSFAATTFVCAQNQITLKPIQDTYVASENANSNYGGQTDLEVENYQYNLGQIYLYQSIVWLKFNLSSIPAGAAISSATLQLYTFLVSSTQTVQGCYCSDDSWTELGITWTNMPTVGFIPVDSLQVATDSHWYSWNVSGALDYAKSNNNLTTVTIALISQSTGSSSSFVWFVSKEQTVYFTDYSPKLTLQYISASPTPTPTPTPTQSPSQAPTLTNSPTSFPTPTLTRTPTPAPTTTPTPTPTPTSTLALTPTQSVPEFSAVFLLPFVVVAITLLTVLCGTKTRRIIHRKDPTK